MSKQSSDAPPGLKLSKELGSGAFGTVYLGEWRTKTVAVKVMKTASSATNPAPTIQNDLETVAETELQQEVSILRQCQHENLVRFFDLIRWNGCTYLIMEYCSGGSLSTLRERLGRALHEAEIGLICRDILHGLVFLHGRKRSIVHRDIKSENLLIGADGLVKVADFGVSRQLENAVAHCSTLVGSPYWMAPEVVLQHPYTSKADIWSLGIVVYELVTGNPPYANVHPMRLLLQLPHLPVPQLPEQRKYAASTNTTSSASSSSSSDGGNRSRSNSVSSHPQKSDALLRDFLSKCLVKDAGQRWTAEQLLAHPFVARYARNPTTTLKIRHNVTLKVAGTTTAGATTTPPATAGTTTTDSPAFERQNSYRLSSSSSDSPSKRSNGSSSHSSVQSSLSDVGKMPSFGQQTSQSAEDPKANGKLREEPAVGGTTSTTRGSLSRHGTERAQCSSGEREERERGSESEEERFPSFSTGFDRPRSVSFSGNTEATRLRSAAFTASKLALLGIQTTCSNASSTASSVSPDEALSTPQQLCPNDSGLQRIFTTANTGSKASASSERQQAHRRLHQRPNVSHSNEILKRILSRTTRYTVDSGAKGSSTAAQGGSQNATEVRSVVMGPRPARKDN